MRLIRLVVGTAILTALLSPGVAWGQRQAGAHPEPARVVLQTGPPDRTSQRTVTFGVADDSTGPFQWSLDGRAWRPTSSQFVTLRRLHAGRHVFRIRQPHGPTTTSRFTVTSMSARSASAMTRPTRAMLLAALQPPSTPPRSTTPAILVADNMNRRILVISYSGKILWKWDNPTGDKSAYSGPLGLRWLPNGDILATFGTGQVGEIDPQTKKFVWETTGVGGQWFSSPYDAAIMSDGNLAVASARSHGGIAQVFAVDSGKAVFHVRANFDHMVEPVANGRFTDLLVGGFGPLEMVRYDPGHADNMRVDYRWKQGSTMHRALVAPDGNLIINQHDFIYKVKRGTQHTIWRRWQGNSHNETRGIAITPTGYVIGHRTWRGPAQLRFLDRHGRYVRQLTTLSDGSHFNLIWDVRTLRWPY